ncbi:MAG: hypothetical protein P8Y74_03240 [Desulfobacterales bacterium]
MGKDVFEEAPAENTSLEKGSSHKPTVFDPFGRIAIRLNSNLGAITIRSAGHGR